MDRLRQLEVVIEAVPDRRADGDLHPRIEAANRLRQQVRRRVSQDIERIRVVAVTGGEDLDLSAVRERQPEILDVAVPAHEHGVLRKLGANRLGSIEPR